MRSNQWTLPNGCYLQGERWQEDTLHFSNGLIHESAAGQSLCFDAEGLLLVPGIIDLHGDAFERNISPRPGVLFDVKTALMETDRQLLANGITTAYLAMTISWEPGLRSLDKAIEIVDALHSLKRRLLSDIRLQLRWEITALECFDQVKAWLSMSPTPVLAFNDHFTDILESKRQHSKLPQYAARAGMTIEQYVDQIKTKISRQEEITTAVKEMTAAAADAGVTCLSHDEPSATVRRDNRSLGISVCEFPLTEDTAREASAHKEHIILGAPNVVRGGSHIGAVDATTAIEQDLCTVLATDYFYPAPLAAVSKLAGGNKEKLAEQWKVISTNAARAVELNDRGDLVIGQRADVLALSQDNSQLSVEAVFVNGQPHFIADPARLHTATA